MATTCVGCGLNTDSNGDLHVDACSDGAVACGDTAADQNCVYVKLQPAGAIVNDQTGNDQFGASGGGLKVKFPADDPGGPSSALFGDCFHTDGAGRLTIKLDPTPGNCNAVKCTPEGLYVPCEQNIHEIDQCTINGLPQTVVEAGSGRYQFEGNKNWLYGNPGCCLIQGRVVVEGGGYAFDMAPGFYATATVNFSRDGGLTWVSPYPQHFAWFDNRAGTINKMQSIPVIHESQLNEQAPGDFEQYIAGIKVFVIFGSAVLGTFGARAGFEFHRDMTSVGCEVCANISAGDISQTTPGFNNNSLSYIPYP